MLLRILKMLLGGAATTAGAAMLALYLYQNRLVYPSWAQGARDFVDTPDKYGLPFEEVHLKTADGVEIRAFDIRQKNSNVTWLILCPNAGNMGYFLSAVELIYRRFNSSVFIYSYRGYGFSEGSPSEQGLKHDADAVMSFLQQDSFYKTQKLILYGRSLGGANAVYIAEKFPQLCDGVILENTFLSIPKVIPHVFPWLSPFSFLCHEKWDSENDIKRVDPTIPWLFLSGQKDEIVPPQHMARLHNICPSERKSIVEFPRGFHNDTIIQEGYWECVEKFLSDYI
ncbi:LANO_0F00804g1_1 [Lachancea nothofagi CBS 11611]|uniref:LANO_0F00804g1_1 n=1 Tax=Lachancea nothofagi CBS 11611 TaxID=1266666 RepID=A0A1G4K5M5_9SACH|nr:LANO_0F00804g1_1 [Lachancea nothofagi CBS 11611]